jgi:hypothetical protein
MLMIRDGGDLCHGKNEVSWDISLLIDFLFIENEQQMRAGQEILYEDATEDRYMMP